LRPDLIQFTFDSFPFFHSARDTSAPLQQTTTSFSPFLNQIRIRPSESTKPIDHRPLMQHDWFSTIGPDTTSPYLLYPFYSSRGNTLFSSSPPFGDGSFFTSLAGFVLPPLDPCSHRFSMYRPPLDTGVNTRLDFSELTFPLPLCVTPYSIV